MSTDGTTIGILGGGQLGQMLVLAGYPLGLRASCFDHTADVPAAIVGDVTAGDVKDAGALRRWASNFDVITYEFENFAPELVADLSEVRPTFPRVNALAIGQDRWTEKRAFDECEIPVSPFRTATTIDEVADALEDLGAPVVAKTRRGGYDGKGQAVLRTTDDLPSAAALLETHELIVEQWVSFEAEVSAIGVRGRNGDVAVYPLIENEHRQGILHSSRAPARFSGDITRQATEHLRALMTKLDYIGVLAVEFFVVNGRLFANEMAPRVHNSGHWTIEGAETSQFENHMRAVANMPIGSTAPRGISAMINIVGRAPRSRDILAIPGAHLHLYGKSERPGRKLGHVTITADDQSTLEDRYRQADEAIHNQLS